MTENIAGRVFGSGRAAAWDGRWFWATLAVALAALCLALAVVLETRFDGLKIESVQVAETPVTIYSRPAAVPAPAVILAHGFGGSRQMMDQIAVSIARQGFVVASIDLPGHGRHVGQMSPDISNIDGTTADLVSTVAAISDAVMARPDTIGPVSYVGHSMATDVVIRAAQLRSDVGAVVAISMYSPAVTATMPARLLVLSGATESHLRDAGLAAAQLVDPAAREGETVSAGGTIRRTAVVPFVGHVGVLYAPEALDETALWIRQATGAGEAAALDETGWIAGLFLAALLALFWPLSALIPARKSASYRIVGGTFLACLLAPVPVALTIAALPVFGVAGHAAFGTLGAILAAWGAVQLALLFRIGVRLARPDIVGVAVYLALALVFALALDRYGAAFVPTGDRAVIAAFLLIGTLPLMLADTLLAQGATILQRILLRLSLIAGLSIAMALSPAQLGLTFTVIPVLMLFFLVYGSLGRWIAARRGIEGVAIGKGMILAWAIAASTPLFAA